MLEFAEGEGKPRTFSSKTLFNGASAVTDLVFEFFDVVVIDAVMVECVRAKEETTLLQISYLAPGQRMLAGALAHLLSKVPEILRIATFAGINVIGIDEEHGIHAVPFELRSYLRIAVTEAIVEGEGQGATIHTLATSDQPDGLLEIDKIAMLVELGEQACKAFSIGIVIVVPIYHVSIENVDKRGWLAERSCNAEVSISKKCAEWIRHIFYEQMTFFNTLI